jgi:hypothetical protein
MEAFLPSTLCILILCVTYLILLFQVSDVTDSHYFTLGVGCVGKSRIAFLILVFLWKNFFYQALIFPLPVNSYSLSCFAIVISSKDVILSCTSKARMYIYRCSLLIGPDLENTFMLLISILYPFMFCTSTVMDQLCIIVWVVCRIRNEETSVRGISVFPVVKR